jgi:prefoldin subunit 5
MSEGIGTEIRSFYSIKEIIAILEEEVEQYKSVVTEYSQWLGTLLRDSKAIKENEEWAKKMAALQKANPKGKTNQTKEDKSKKPNPSVDWIQFKEIKLSSNEIGETEILFDAIEELNNKIRQIEKVRNSLGELEKSGLGKEIIYVTYIHDGVPEKIVLRHKKTEEFAKKFQYIADFSIARSIEG